MDSFLGNEPQLCVSLAMLSWTCALVLMIVTRPRALCNTNAKVIVNMCLDFACVALLLYDNETWQCADINLLQNKWY